MTANFIYRNPEIAQIITEANGHDLNADTSSWVEELAEIGPRGAWQDQGYFGVKVTAAAQSLGGNSSEERFLVGEQKRCIVPELEIQIGNSRLNIISKLRYYQNSSLSVFLWTVVEFQQTFAALIARVAVVKWGSPAPIHM